MSNNKILPRLYIILPVQDAGKEILYRLELERDSQAILQWQSIKDAPVAIESSADAERISRRIVDHIIQVERDGADAVVVDCMAEPGVEEAQQYVSIPVYGLFQTAMSFIAAQGKKTVIICNVDECRTDFTNQAKHHGFESILASCRPINIPIRNLNGNRDFIIERIVEQCRAAVEHDQADTLLLSCTTMSEMTDDIRKRLAEFNLHNVQLIDPLALTIRIAQAALASRQAETRCLKT